MLLLYSTKELENINTFLLSRLDPNESVSCSSYNNCTILAHIKCSFIFFLSVLLGHIEVVKLLVAHGAEVTCKDKKSYTPLHAAASSGMISVVKYLLDLGVDVRKNKSNFFFLLV